ncbi:ABC transporter permease [Streptomyces sp. DSM 44915]|uniref:Transport permease protein n=2 Tax=Streptomyces chisholmiae TaxID=3075540 RepID=A0ABU2JXC5_9ACTN|nr:ABC transporter permease [Streptomyces sp. DSM 44915]MDT0269512.1 ABC transporter permease [Streptomyces sp. DSM 44915]
MTRRGLAHWARQPGQFLANQAFSVMMLIMFAYFLGGGMAVEGGGDYVDFLVPGMLVLTMAFGLESTMVELTSDINRGILDRFRSMPIAPSAVLVGRSLLDMLNSVVGLLVLTAAGWLVGWRWHAGAAEVLAALGLLLLLRFAMLWIGVYLALVAGRPELVQTVQILVWPLGFLSSAFVSPDTMPGWVGALAEWNPMSATAGAVRELFGNPAWSGGSWAAQHPAPLAVLWPLVLLATFVPLALRRFARLGA